MINLFEHIPIDNCLGYHFEQFLWPSEAMIERFLYAHPVIVAAFYPYNFYASIKIIKTFNHMVNISEYQPMRLRLSNHLTPVSAEALMFVSISLHFFP